MEGAYPATPPQASPEASQTPGAPATVATTRAGVQFAHGRGSTLMARTRVLGILAAAVLLAGCGGRQSGVAAVSPTDPQTYAPMCAEALVAAKEFSRRLRTSTATDDPPVIVSPGPPVRIRCAIRNRRGVPGDVTADIVCLDPFRRTCVVPVAATLNGRIVQGPGRIGPDRWP
jgi:hypothetical protein